MKTSASGARIGTQRYGAPWGRALTLISVLVTALLIAVAVTAFTLQRLPPLAPILAALIPPLVIFLCLLFIVRGYTITEESLLVHRLLWDTRISLRDLQSVERKERAMRYAIRLFGNGGMYSFTGIFRNRELGIFRAFVTDLKRCVVLRFPKRTIVVSPDAPERFVAHLAEFVPRR